MIRTPEFLGETLPEDFRRRVAETLGRFEEDWLGGKGPEITELLEDFGPAERSTVLQELVGLEIVLRLEAGDLPTVDDYADRFPDDPSALQAAFTAGRDPTVETHRAPNDETTLDAATTVPDGGRDRRGEIRPRWLGRYQVLELLGQGTFGYVYLARDLELDREVAIKVSRVRSMAADGELESLLAEARNAAKLRHPAIVGVHDAGRDEAGSAFIVLEYVKGKTLADVFAKKRLDPGRLAGLVAEIAEAVHHAHEAGLVHRDLKPSNIMMDELGRPRVTDFGLALTEALRLDRAGEVAGTPTYMAPEQVRGESHRLDARTDVWALGVILYRGLANRLPFPAGDREVLFQAILQREPKPPGLLNPDAPRELERICLKCISKRMTDRYASARAVADDLRHWLAGTKEPARVLGSPFLRVVPKGLRAFDAGDADFFLALLPGPKGRDGLPESIRFWKAWAQARDDEPGRAAGLLYGPSGAGKSSMLRAGLLPVLGESVHPVVVEATRDGTEARLLAALRRAFPDLSGAEDLAETATWLREGRAGVGDRKILIVLDQFEQWLQADRADPEADLVRALRQCDGRRLQVLILVRDDFWTPVARFFKQLEVPLAEGWNSTSADPFDQAHARRVLAEFGRACGQVSDGSNPAVSEFLDLAIADLIGPGGSIPPVKLSLFFEVVRRRPWTPKTLRGLGGVEGIGVIFLEGAFETESAPPAYRAHRDAAQAILEALLPPPSSVLRDGLRPARELLKASGYADRPGDFADLIRILDTDLRIITPGRPGRPSEADETSEPGAGEASYQLAHEFLITPIRQWIERKRRATRSGRARNRLATITASWCERPIPQRLASPLEWAGILAHTRPRSWSRDERRMMLAAIYRTLAQAAAAVAIAAAVVLAVHLAREHERAEMLLQRSLKADFAALPDLIPELEPYQSRIRTGLEARESARATPKRERRVATLLLFRDRPTGPRADALRSWLHEAGPIEVHLVREAIALHPEGAGLDRLHAEARDAADPSVRLRLVCTLVRLQRGGVSVTPAERLALTQALLAEDRRTIPKWLELLGPVMTEVAKGLLDVSSDPWRDPPYRVLAAEALAEALAVRNEAIELARATVQVQDESGAVLRKSLKSLDNRKSALAVYHGVLQSVGKPQGDRHEAEEQARRQAGAAIGLANLGEADPLWPLLRRRDNPTLRAILIDRLANSQLPANLLLDRLALPEIEASERQALLLAWAEAIRDSVTPPVEQAVVEMARRLYFQDPDPGVHSAAELVGARRGGKDVPDHWEEELRLKPPPAGSKRWELGPNGHTLAILRGPLVFRMGSPMGEAMRLANESAHYRRVDRSIAVATKEVTVEQFKAFNPGHPQDHRHSTEPGCPANNVTWLEAVRYCNWLSRQAGLEECYEIRPNGVVLSRAEGRNGYRLPTEAEAEYLVRGGAETAHPFGETETLLSQYAWTWMNSDNLSRPVGRLLPNAFGIFDAQGNIMEWCHDGVRPGDRDPYYPPYPAGTLENPALDPLQPEDVATSDANRLLRSGAFGHSPDMVRSATRHESYVYVYRHYIGLRVVRTIPDPIGPPR